MEIDGPQFYAIIPLTFQLDGKRGMEVIGSGVMAHIFGQGVIVTAAHVLDEQMNGTLFFPAEDRFVVLNGPMFCSEAPGGDREEDQVDVGYVMLGSAANLRHDPAVRPLEFSDMQADVLSDGLNGYTFVGYPWRKSRRRGADITSAQQRFTGTGLTAPELVRQGLDPNLHIAIHFHRNKSNHGGSLRATAPLPQGLSGGGIFAWPKAPKGRTTLPDNFPLVGIAHTYLESKCLLVGTKIEGILSAMKKNMLK